MREGLHERSIVIDSLQVGAEWERPLLEELRAGGLTCVHTTSIMWEGPGHALDELGKWRRRFEANADIIMPIWYGGTSNASIRRVLEYADGMLAGRCPFRRLDVALE